MYEYRIYWLPCFTQKSDYHSCINYLEELVVKTSGRPEASLLPNRTRVCSGNVITDNTSEKGFIAISCNARNSSGVSIRTDGKGIAKVPPVEIAEGFRRIRSHTLRTTDDLVAGGIIGTHWGRGPMETSDYIVNTLKTLVQFTQPFTTRYILGTFEM